MGSYADLHVQLRDVARDLLSKDVDRATRRRQVADAGWFGLEVPEGLDGSGVTFAETAVVLEELGRAATAVPYLGTAVLGIGALAAVEASAERDGLLRAVAAGTVQVAAALAPHADAAVSEPPFRLDVRGRLEGRADLVVDAGDADRLLLLSEAPGGLAVVNAAATDVVVHQQRVLDATRSFAAVEADGVAVSDASVWRFEDDPALAAQAVIDRATVAVAADAHGVASAMLDATVAYVGVRRQFDRPVGSFQAVKHQCADVLVQQRIGRELLEEAVAAVAAGVSEAGVAASRAKSHLGAAAVDAAGVAMQLHGGVGYTWESGIHRYLKRALLDRALFGSPATHRQRIADAIWPMKK